MAVTITISGQCPSGKNAITVTRTGLRFPSKRFATWKAHALAEIAKQLPKDFKPFSTPVDAAVFYTPADKRRRDVPGIIDAVWHVLEKAGVVADDCLLGGISDSRRSVFFLTEEVNKDNPKVTVGVYGNADDAPKGAKLLSHQKTKRKSKNDNR